MKRSADRAATQKQGLLAIIGARKRRVLIIQRITLRHIAEEDIPSPHRSARCPYLASEAYNASSYFNLRCSPRARRCGANCDDRAVCLKFAVGALRMRTSFAISVAGWIMRAPSSWRALRRDCVWHFVANANGFGGRPTIAIGRFLCAMGLFIFRIVAVYADARPMAQLKKPRR